MVKTMILRALPATSAQAEAIPELWFFPACYGDRHHEKAGYGKPRTLPSFSALLSGFNGFLDGRDPINLPRADDKLLAPPFRMACCCLHLLPAPRHGGRSPLLLNIFPEK